MPDSRPPDPITRFDAWWREARAGGDRWADAMVLATATADGRPSARAVILRGVDESGFLFFTDTRSPKAADLAANPRAALVFLWPGRRRQVRVGGTVSRAGAGEAEAFFAARPPEANLAASIAPQSEVLAGGVELERRLEERRAALEGTPVPVPPGWGGYRLAPDEIEFWEERPRGLHDRRRCRRQPEGGWVTERLAP